MTASLRPMLLRLLHCIQAAQQGPGRALSQQQRAANAEQRRELRALLDRTDWNAADGRHVAYHMLTAVPWSATAVRSRATAPLSAWLGDLFDDTSLPRRSRRGIANVVIDWADRWLRDFANLRGTLLLHD